jgi:hypothetical protein
MKIVLQDGELEESLLLCFKGMVVLLGEKRNVRMILCRIEDVAQWKSTKNKQTKKLRQTQKNSADTFLLVCQTLFKSSMIASY